MATKTSENLVKAFAGESQAYQRYMSFATRAEAEGYHQIAKLFRATAAGEKIHAAMYLTSVNAIGTTAENLGVAIKGETEEYAHMYPEMIVDAEADGDKIVKNRFNWAKKTEEGHANRFKMALENIGNEQILDYHVCQTCGWLADGQSPEVCPVCGAPRTAFSKVD